MRTALVNNIDYNAIEEHMAAILVEAWASKEEMDFYRELVLYCSTGVSTSRCGMPIDAIVGSFYDTIIPDDIAEEQPKKRPAPFYQTLHKQPKFVRK